MTRPPVTVLMAVYNGRPFVRTAIESILTQSYRDFRFLIVDDASTDDTRDIVRSYDDSRIELLPLARNVGQTAALNLGLKHAVSPWIARMDADDYSAPPRLEHQMNVLSGDASLRCVGTWIWEFRDDPHARDSVVARPETYPEIRRASLHGAGVIHGSAVLCRESLLAVGGYDERLRYASDREMFIRFLARYPARNIQRPLVGIRRHPGQDSFSKAAADEYIAIFLALLADPRYVHDVATLRAGLSFSYAFRARYWQSRRCYREMLKDVARSVRLAPGPGLRRLARYAIRG